jgi:hypothetical protein
MKARARANINETYVFATKKMPSSSPLIRMSNI